MKLSSIERPDDRPLKSCLCYLTIWRSVTILCSLFVVAAVLVLCKAYVRGVLLWLEDQDGFVVSVTVCLLYIIVSLPISVGYIVLVIAGGYLFGVAEGMLLAIVGANFGLIVAHNLLKAVGDHHRVRRFTENETAKAIMRVISGPLCFKIVFCSRLTPIPFGLQNVIFAVSTSACFSIWGSRCEFQLSNVKGTTYHAASLLGLIPAQLVAVYIGTTLRSMQDVLENRSIGPATYLFVGIQVRLV